MRTFGIALLLFLLLFSYLPATVRASDDSNNGQLTPTPQIEGQLFNTISQLSQNINDSHLKQLIKEFENQVNTGGNISAATTLAEIQSYINSNRLSIPGSLYSLLNSLYISNNQLYLNQTLLSQLLGLLRLDQNGVPSGLANENPAQASIDLQAIGSFLSYIDPRLAAEIFNIAAGIQVSPTQERPTQSQYVQAAPSLPQLNNIPISPIELKPLIPSSLAYFFIPILIIPIMLLLFRKKMLPLLGEQKIPDDIFVNNIDVIKHPSTNREKIIHIFQKSLRFISLKGIKKMVHETHREFSQRISGNKFSSEFSTISNLYEKAKFSGSEIKFEDVLEAERSYQRLERIES